VDVSQSTSPATPAPKHAVRRSAAFFDLDKTVIARSSALAFSRPFYRGGLINRRSVLRSAYAQFVFLVGGADHDQMERMREYMSALIVGWPVETVRDIVAETLHTIVDPIVYGEAVTLIDEHHLAGRDVVIVSSSGAELVAPIGDMLSVDRALGSTLEVEDGRYTGAMSSYLYAEAKAEAIGRLAEQEGYDLARSYAYSDSITDLPLLEAVGHPYAVNPDRALRREAAARGWPVLVFSQPVALRRRAMRERLDSRTVAIAAGAAAAVTAGALTWYLVSRRPS